MGAQRVAMFVQRGQPTRKQEDMCFAYCAEQRWEMRWIVPFWAPEDAVAMVHDGAVSVVVVAFDSPAVRSLAADIGPAGRVIAVHPKPRMIEPPMRGIPESLADLILRWWRRGRSVPNIAQEIEADTGDVREILRRQGEQPGQTG